jgi:hypothetical protein
MTALYSADRVLQPVADSLTPHVARRIVVARFHTETQSWIDELVAKASRGTLTDEEREEYAEFIACIDGIGIIKAKARLLLKKRSG